MKQRRNLSAFLIWSLPLCIIVSVLLTSLLAFGKIKQLNNNFQGMFFLIEANEEFDASLYYTYTDQFNDSLRLLDSASAPDTIWFRYSSQKGVVKQFRLDLGNNSALRWVKIKELHLLFENETIILNEEEVFKSLFVHSESVSLEKNKQLISIQQNSRPFDPYIVFAPLGQISLQKDEYVVALLLPFAVMILFFYLKLKSRDTIRPEEFLIALFIICIPLKIAWTTFSTLLLGIYGVLSIAKTRKLKANTSLSLVLLAIFILYVLFGRPDSISAIDKEFALVLFAFIGMTVVIRPLMTYWTYFFVFITLNAILVSAGISYLLWFNDFYGLEVVDYFRQVKIYSGNMRDWLYYDHAAFLSFFGISGILFMNELRKNEVIDNKITYLYHGLLALTILLMGSRICILIYALYLLNILANGNLRKRVIINILIFTATAAIIVLNIEKIDPNRNQLWAVSWAAFKERPLVGYGLGGAELILKDKDLNFKAGYSVPSIFNHAHNQIITTILEIGIMGTICILTIIIVFISRSVQIDKNNMFLFLMGLAYIFLTESILQTSKPLYVICFLFLLLAQKTKTNNYSLKG
jgi:O-antigen ligase